MLLFWREGVDLLEPRAALQSALNRVKKWAWMNLAFSKGKCKSLQLGWNNFMQCYTVRAVWLESSFAEHQAKKGAKKSEDWIG